MKFIKKPWFVPIILTIVILAIGIYYTKHLVTQVEALPESEIRKQLEDVYGGKVERLSLDGTMYEAELSRNKDLYVAKVDAETGKVLSLIQTKEVIEEEQIASVEEPTTPEVKEEEQPVQNNVQPDKITTEPDKITPPKPSTPEKGTASPTPPKKEATTVLISKNQAIKIALGQMKGEVDDVEFVKTSDGGYYLVEIENDKDEEAVFQIHAISGKIMSVTRDD